MVIHRHIGRSFVPSAGSRAAHTAGLALALALSLGTAGPALAVGTAMFSTVAFSTGEKPQSKIWYHDGSYWAVVDGPNGLAIYEKTGSSWAQRNVLASGGQADVKWNGSQLFILNYASTSQLFKYTYNSSQRSWVIASGFPVNLPSPGGSETMVLEQDSTGRLWTTVVTNGNVHVYYSTSADHRTWNSTAVVLQTGINADDISSIVAFGGNKVGVFWSDQNRDEFGFRIHNDADSPTTWQTKESVFAGSGHADDHLNLAFDSSGRVYAITKDDLNEMAVHRRSTSGSWTTKTNVVGGESTRGIIMVAEADSKVYILYTRWGVTPERIEYRVADINTLTFGGETVFISSSNDMNNVTGMKQLLPAGSLIALAEDGSNCYYNSFGNPPGGGGPTPPGAPQNLAATLGSNAVSVNLSWSPPSTGTAAGYNVYRSLNGGASTKLNSSLVASTSYTDSSPVQGQLCYTVTAVSPEALEGAASNSDCLDYVPPPPPPSAPLNVVATLQGTNPESVRLVWQAPTTGVPVGYEVRRSDGGAAYVKIHSGLVAGLSYVDSNLFPGELCYTVTAVDALSRSGPASSAACADYIPPAPSAPLGLQVAMAPLAFGPATGAGAWAFDEESGQTVDDATGNGHVGQLGSASGTDSADPAWTDGVTGGALQFDGSNDRVVVPDDPELRIGPSFTVEAWVNRGSSSSSDVILSKGDSNERNFLLLIDSSSRIDFRWEVSGGSNHGALSAAQNWTGWHHVACVYDAAAGENRIYFDGALVESASDSGTPTTSSDPIYIGARLSSGSLRDWFVGSIDLVRVASFAMYDQDFTPPTQLGNSTPVPRFQLTWQPPVSSEWLAGYHVYRRVDGWPAERLTTTPIPDASYVDVGPPVGTISYYVSAVDLVSQEGPASLVASIPNRLIDMTKSGERPGERPVEALALQVEPVLRHGPSEIRYALPAAATVRLAVYDVRGRLVALLDDGRREPGTHAVRWPGGDQVASGTYFLLLTADGQRISRKTTLIR